MSIAQEKREQNSCLLNTDRLNAARVLLIGAGGLGCNIAVHLAGAGIGRLDICDFDSVAQSNFNRQFIYSSDDLGLPKADAATRFISKYAPDCTVSAINRRISSTNAEELIAGCDLVILSCDNIATRLAVNEVCARLGTALLDSGISGACGSTYLYIPGESACLNCIMDCKKESPDKRTVSAAAGIIGGFAAMTALSFISGNDRSRAGKLIITDALNGTVDELPVKKSGECKICGGDIYV